jgi:hypothetical protein
MRNDLVLRCLKICMYYNYSINAVLQERLIVAQLAKKMVSYHVHKSYHYTFP